MQKKSRSNTIISRFLQGIWFHTVWKTGKIVLTYCFPKETITAIIMLYRNTKVKVRSLERDTDFDIVAGVLRGDILSLYMFIIYLYNVNETSIDLIWENDFTLKKQTVSHRIYSIHWLCRWHTTSGKYPYPSRIPAAIWSRQQETLTSSVRKQN